MHTLAPPLLALNIVWDFASAYALVTYDGTKRHALRDRWAKMHLGWWVCEVDYNLASRNILANFLIILGLMRCMPLVDDRASMLAITSYAWEIFWLLAGAYCSTMFFSHVMPSVVMCAVCVALLVHTS